MIEAKELLKKMLDENIIKFADVLELEENMKIEEVKKLHKYSICKTADGRLKTNVKVGKKRKPIYGYTERELWLKLADWYAEETKTFEMLFYEMCDYRLRMKKVKEKTIIEYKNVFKRFFKDTEFIKKPIQNITFSDTVKFFDLAHTKTKVKGKEKEKISKQNQRDIKTVISKTYAYANQVLGMEVPCQMSLMDFSDYKVEDKTSKEFYSEEERNELLDHLDTIPDEKKDAYDWGIELDFELGLRIGELKALRYPDVKNDAILVHAQVLEKQVNGHKVHEYVEHVKTQNEEGIRVLPFSDRAKKIMEKLKSCGFDEEFLFKKDGRFLTTCTFNRHLEKHCKAAGIPYRSSHKIRFGFATMLISNGCPLDELPSILGHTTVEMSSHYVRIVQKAEKNANMLKYVS